MWSLILPCIDLTSICVFCVCGIFLSFVILLIYKYLCFVHIIPLFTSNTVHLLCIFLTIFQHVRVICDFLVLLHEIQLKASKKLRARLLWVCALRVIIYKGWRRKKKTRDAIEKGCAKEAIEYERTTKLAVFGRI